MTVENNRLEPEPYDGDPAELYAVPADEQLDEDPPRDVAPADLSRVTDDGEIVTFGSDD